MANAERGEVAVTIGGRPYTLNFGTNAMCEVETLFSTPTHRVTCRQIQNLARQGEASAVRGLLWAALRKHHREVTLEAAGELIDASGPELIAALARVGQLSEPHADDVRALGVKPRPQTAQRRPGGTGRRFNGKPSRRV